jgi:Rrf2 family protein
MKAMFSKTCEYGIRAMIFIAQKSKDKKRVGIKEIAKAIDAPEHFIAKILQDLGRKGLVQSLKGPSGGFYVKDSSALCSIADIVKAIDGDKIFTGCGLGLKNCNELKPCPIHNQFKKLRESVFTVLENARIGEFSKKLEKNLAVLRRK